MVHRDALRDVIGHIEFDAAMKYYETHNEERPSVCDKEPTAQPESQDGGKTIEEAREALARASERSFD